MTDVAINPIDVLHNNGTAVYGPQIKPGVKLGIRSIDTQGKVKLTHHGQGLVFGTVFNSAYDHNKLKLETKRSAFLAFSTALLPTTSICTKMQKLAQIRFSSKRYFHIYTVHLRIFFFLSDSGSI